MRLLELSGLLAAVLALCVLSAPPVGADALSPEAEFDEIERGLDKLKTDAARVRAERDRVAADLKRVLDCVKKDLTRSIDLLEDNPAALERLRSGIRHRLELVTTDLSFTYPAKFFPQNPRGSVEVARTENEVWVVFLANSEAPSPDSATLEDLVEAQGKMLGRMRSDLLRAVEKLRASHVGMERRDKALRVSAERADRLAGANRALKERVELLERRLSEK